MSDEDRSNAAIAEPNGDERAAKRLKTDDATTPAAESGSDNKAEANGTQNGHSEPQQRDRNDNRGAALAPVKKEYLIDLSTLRPVPEPVDDDAAEGRGSARPGDDRDRDHRGDGGQGNNKKNKKKNKGQNTDRSFGKFDDELPLCNSRAFTSEFSPRECRFGDRCRLCHDLRKYLKEGRREDLTTWGGVCPVYEQHGTCPTGWKCRFVRSHMKEVEHEDGRKELTLLVDETKAKSKQASDDSKGENEETNYDMFNVVPMGPKIELNRKRTDFKRTETYIKWLDGEARHNHDLHHRDKDASEETVKDLRAQFIEAPFKPSEKRRLYFGPETPTLAPLTTQGNLPFRRLCVELGAQLTYSEMALSMPLLQGTKADWTLMKAHKTEVEPPTVKIPVFDNSYDHSRDMRFGAQISGSAVWVVTKAADILNRLCPQLRVIDLNCGCPIDMVFKSGGGSALLESQGKLERMIRGMNAVSGEVPITAKIRMGVKNNRPTAPAVIERLAFGAKEHRERLGAPGCAAITLHGRSREQRYTKLADWSYIGDCAALIKSYNDKKAALTDTAAEPDASTLPNSKDGKMYFLGNGDCYSHIDYYNHLETAKVDSVMIGRGALIKPWLFEEIEKGQYLDKSASERLTYIEKFARYGLEAWGSDELGIGFTRRFLLEWLSFSCRYIPIGVLEHLPPSINQRPPAYHGRNDLETLMASTNFKDWIKLTEMYLGPVHPGFQFQPKHKSNAYEAEG